MIYLHKDFFLHKIYILLYSLFIVVASKTMPDPITEKLGVNNIRIALIVVVTFLIVCNFTHKYLVTNKGSTKSLTQKVIDDAAPAQPCTEPDCACNEHPKALPLGSAHGFMSAHASNTLEQRPGNKYILSVLPEVDVPPAFTILLLYTPHCEQHQLTMLFRHIRKQFTTDETAANYNIGFNEEIVPPTLGPNMLAGLPKVVKVRRSGQILEYKGYTDYGQLSDFILNESILFT